MDVLNYIFVFLSIGFGCFGWLAPHYTMSALDLRAGDSSMGVSEIRASVGALFVGLGIGALLLDTTAAYAMIGFAWGGAAIGRGTSLVLDGRSAKKWLYFGVEAIVALGAIWINLGA